MPRSLTPAEVARQLRVTPRTVRNWIRDGRLRAERVSDRVTRIPADEVDRLLGLTPSTRPDLSSVLWDVDWEHLDETADARFVIRRVLETGRPDQVAWLFRRYPPEVIADVAERDRALPHRVAVAWGELLRRRREHVA
jgi:excisionase family DNA binding protein